MKNSKLLNKKYLLSILFFLLLGFTSQAQEPVDIWNVEEKKKIEKNQTAINLEDKKIPENSIYKMQSRKDSELNIKEDLTLTSKERKIIGLYDPAENGLDINMWSNSNGDQILNIFKRINKMDLSKY